MKTITAILMFVLLIGTTVLGEDRAGATISDLLSDSFEGTTLNTCKWFNESWNGAQIHQDNELILSTNSNYSASGARIYTQYQFMGDFDVQVDFRAGSGWTDRITPSGSTIPQLYAAMGIFVDEPGWIHIVRMVNPNRNTLILYSNIPGQGTLASVDNDARSGKFRIVRTGSNVAFKYDTGKGWQDLHTISAFATSVYIYLTAGSVDTNHALTTYFDNFLINSGETSYAPLAWSDQFQRRPDFYVGGVVCDYLAQQVWGQHWKQLDPLQTLKENGVTWVRAGVITTSSQYLRGTPPPEWNTLGWRGEYWSSLEYAEQILRQASEKGLRLNLFFYLSDMAAHGGQQNAPPEWAGLSVDDMARALETYTCNTTQYFLNRGLKIELYDIGNEIDKGILNFRPGERIALPPGVNVITNMDYMRNNVWNIEATLLKSAISGVKRADPDAKIVLHIAELGTTPGDLFVKSFFKAMIDEGVEFDYAGLSHPYPFTGWPLSDYSTYCWFQRLQETIDFLASLGKKVIFSEAAYPHDPAGIEGNAMQDFPYTPAGQAVWLRNQLRFASNSENVIGFFYFYPESFPGMSADSSTLNLQSSGLFASDTQAEPAMEEFRVNLGPLTPLSTLTVIKAGTGSGMVTSSPSGIYCGTHCTETYNNGSSVTLTATADPGTAFAGWAGGECSGTGTCIVTMNADKAVTATFTPFTPSQNTLTLNKSGAGTGAVTSSPAGISCGPTCKATFATGTSLTLTASADAGSTFTGWSGGGCSGTDPCTITLNSNTTIDASFALSGSCAYTISPTSKTFKADGGNVSIKVSATGLTNCPMPLVVEGAEWISVSGTPSWKTNKGTLKIAVQKNSSSQNRTAAVTIGGETLTVGEDGAVCQLTALKPSSGKYPNTGGSGSFDITVSPQDCGWNVTTTFEWIHLDTTTETGNGTAVFHLDANGTGKNRTGKIDVALPQNPTKKKTFTVNENK